MQYLQAAILIATYFVLCRYCLRPLKSMKSDTIEKNTELTIIAYASQSGESQVLANSLAAALPEARLLSLNQLTPEVLQQTRLVLFIVSSYGEGEPPDNGLRFAHQWLDTAQSDVLSKLRFALLALGDSNYRYFCGFGMDLSEALQRQGATLITEVVTVDRLDSQALLQWQTQLQGIGLIDGAVADFGEVPSAEPDFMARLTQRHLLNEGSPGDPLYLVRLEPSETVLWRAGDILQFMVPAGVEPELREYSIACAWNAASALELLVRQVHKGDDSLGLGSGWLTDSLIVGETLSVRLRSNPAFHAREQGGPMILIGNGTGIAGLRAHLQAAADSGHWLVFGERSRAADTLFEDEIQAWLDSGHLARLDRVFSREDETLRYVQDLLHAEIENLKDWLDRDASIYVCGSQQGMAPAVHRVLLDLLGEKGLEDLTLAGRYRRDIY